MLDGDLGFTQAVQMATPLQMYADFREAGIGFVAQDPLTSLDPNFTVGSLISEAVKRHSGLRGKDALKRTVALLVT